MVSVINKDTEEKHTFDSNCKVAYDGCHKIYILQDVQKRGGTPLFRCKYNTKK